MESKESLIDSKESLIEKFNKVSKTEKSTSSRSGKPFWYYDQASTGILIITQAMARVLASDGIEIENDRKNGKIVYTARYSYSSKPNTYSTLENILKNYYTGYHNLEKEKEKREQLTEH